MKQQTAQGRYAKMLLERGVSYDEIKNDSAMAGFNPATLRTIAKRVRDAKETNETRNETRRETSETVNETAKTALPENALAATENAVSPVSETRNDTPILFDFLKTAFQNFHPADALYFGSVALACNGIASALHGVGIWVSVFYFAVAFVALQGVKTTTGAWRYLHVAVLLVVEVLVGGAAHIMWANEALWANVEALPFDIYRAEFWSADAGKMKIIWAGSQVKWVGYTAIGAAAFLVSAGFYACLIALSNKKKV